MTIQEIRDKVLFSKEYNFLKTNEHLGNNIILIGLGGSYAYGTNTENSDLDIRGCALNTKEEILTNGIFANKDFFEQYTDEETDTTIYSFNKLVSLLSNNNPNVIEMCGLKPEHYLYVHPIGRELLNNRKMFLSKKAINTFGGYANAQTRRLWNKANHSASQSEQERYILNTINNAMYDIKLAYQDFTDEEINLYIDKAVQEGYDTEIFMDVNLKHYPLRDYCSVWNEMKSIVSSYNKIGKRNKHAIEHDKIGKHMMHLIRLYMMCIDILEKEEIITYREAEHDLLMDIRNGKFIDSNNQPTSDFNDLLNEYGKKFDYAKLNTNLPDSPDYKNISEFVMSVNERVVKGDF